MALTPTASYLSPKLGLLLPLVLACLLVACVSRLAHAGVLSGLNVSAGLIEELDSLPEQECMSTWQLHDVIRLAAWNQTVKGVPRSAIILTTCNVKCLQQLFEPFIWGLEHSRDGDFSQHLVIVGNGIAAYLLCDSLRQKHKHHCVLDRMCSPPGSPDLSEVSKTVKYGKPLYWLSLLQKVVWGAEVIRFNTSVLWTDMDITFFGNPLPFLFNAGPDADLMVQSEYWDDGNIFMGDVCKPGGECGTQATQMTGRCCGMAINGGQWLINPTPAGTALVEAWAAALFEDGVVNRRIWDGSATLDQNHLGDISSGRRREAPLYKWDAVAKQYIKYGEVKVPDISMYRISAQRAQSACFGPCGWRGPNVPYENFILNNKLVCVMPKKYVDRLISFHQNCNSDVDRKRTNMMYFLTWTNDETTYSLSDKKVIPDW